MADTPYPLTRQTREHAMINGNGGATYGPFAFKIFDTADVEVLTKAAGATKFSIALVTVTKVSGLALDNFTIAFPANVPATTKIKVLGKRLPERSAGIAKGTRLDMDALEKELSKIAAAQQELRRDVIPMDPEIDNGSTLMLSDGRVIKGPNGSEISSAQGYANAAYSSQLASALSASQAAVSAALAATFVPDNYYTKAQVDASVGAKVSGTLSTDGTLNANSDANVPSQKAVKTYSDGILATIKGGVSAAWDTLAKLLAGLQRKPNVNDIINGDFDIWQRATSQTTNGYGSDDRWSNSHAGSTKTHSQQAFVNGQTEVPGNPKYFSRTVVVSAAGAANYVAKTQPIEGAQRNAGKDVTVTFWAKADAAKNIAIEFVQNFGSGGTPSAQVTGIGSQLISLTTVWQKFTRKVSLPSIAGKTLGTNGNDYVQLIFWFDAGSSFNSRTANLVQQSGTFDIAHVSIVVGDATGEDDPFPYRDPQQELARCQRYYQAMDHVIDVYGAFVFSPYQGLPLPVTMRTAPGVSYSTTSTAGSFSGPTLSASKAQLRGYLAGTGAASNTWVGVVRLDAEL